MLWSYEELIGEDEDIEYTACWMNTELDYILCGHYGVCLDEIERLPIALAQELRVYALFEDMDRIRQYKPIVSKFFG